MRLAALDSEVPHARGACHVLPMTASLAFTSGPTPVHLKQGANMHDLTTPRHCSTPPAESAAHQTSARLAPWARQHQALQRVPGVQQAGAGCNGDSRVVRLLLWQPVVQLPAFTSV
jgi:hypothetical protein